MTATYLVASEMPSMIEDRICPFPLREFAYSRSSNDVEEKTMKGASEPIYFE